MEGCVIENTKRILLVEDDPAHQRLITHAFELWPETMQLEIRSNLAAAQAYLATTLPDLVIADYRLPDGESTALLSSATRGSCCPVVIMTSQGDEQIAAETIKAGAREYVIKSAASMADMPRIVSRVLREWGPVLERQQVEAALHESEERYRLLVELSPDAIAVINSESRLVFVNPATLKLLAITEMDKLIGKSFFDLLAVEEREEAGARLAAMLETGIPPPPREYRFQRADGEEVYGAVTSMPLTYQGAPAIQVITRDVTARKRAQAALQQAHDELESKVYERTRELELANEKLQELDQLKSTFIASMSHELRTPLNSIIGFTGVILEGMSGAINERQHEQLSRVYSSAKHLLSLVSDVIDISKIEAGKIEVEIGDFKVEELIAESVEQFQKLAVSKGLQLTSTLPVNIALHTDRLRLLQVVLNLVSNAVKYTEAGQVNISAEQRGGNLRITVTDTGVGIPENAMPDLFMPFERLDKRMRVKVLGTGLGLYLSKKLTEDLLRGELHAASVYGKGSRFWVEIPQNLTVKSEV